MAPAAGPEVYSARTEDCREVPTGATALSLSEIDRCQVCYVEPVGHWRLFVVCGYIRDGGLFRDGASAKRGL
jgi:hypothetical protein